MWTCRLAGELVWKAATHLTEDSGTPLIAAKACGHLERTKRSQPSFASRPSAAASSRLTDSTVRHTAPPVAASARRASARRTSPSGPKSAAPPSPATAPGLMAA